MRREAANRIVQGIVGIAISVVAAALVLRSVDVSRTWDVLRSASPAWILLVAAALCADLLLRGRRWQELVAPIHRVPYRRLMAYMLVGYLANNVLPARLGELVRSHYLGDREGISRTTTLGTVVVERIVDTAVLVAVAALAILVLHVRGVVASAVLVGFALVMLLTLALAVAVAAHRLPGFATIATFIGRWPRLRSLISRLRGGLAVAGIPRTIAWAVVLSCLAWGATILAYAGAGQAVGIQLTMGEAALLASGVNLVTAIPSAPGYIGTFELAAVTIAEAFSIPADQALALALLAHAGTLAVTSVGGGASLAILGLRRPVAARSEVGSGRGRAVARDPGGPDTRTESEERPSTLA